MLTCLENELNFCRMDLGPSSNTNTLSYIVSHILYKYWIYIQHWFDFQFFNNNDQCNYLLLEFQFQFQSKGGARQSLTNLHSYNTYLRLTTRTHKNIMRICTYFDMWCLFWRIYHILILFFYVSICSYTTLYLLLVFLYFTTRTHDTYDIRTTSTN